MKVEKYFFYNTIKFLALGIIVNIFLGESMLFSNFSRQDVIALPAIERENLVPNAKTEPDFTNDGGDHTGKGTQTTGASRGPCIAIDSLRLTALSPSSNYGRTISPQPKFWFYLPQVSEQHEQELVGEFGVLDASGTPLFDPVNLTFPGQAGYVGISLPTNVSLEVGGNYEWYFSFNCDEGSPATTVSGWVQRVELEPELITQINQSDQDAYNIYVENQIWFDVINYFTMRRIEEPENERLQTVWFELLKAKGIGLEDLPLTPILLVPN